MSQLEHRTFFWLMLTPSALRKCPDAGDSSAEDQSVDVMGALISVDGLQVQDMPHHVILDLDAVAAVHVARGAGDVERLAAIVALDDRDHFGRVMPLVLEPPEAQAGVQAEGDLGLHVDK